MPDAPSMGMTGTTHRYLSYLLTRNNTITKQTDYIDLAADLSLLNSRLYKQGREYFVKSVKFISGDSPFAALYVNTAPCTWSTFTAYRKARALWNRMNRESLADASLSKAYLPKWHDFKIYLDNGHRTKARLIPRDGQSVQSQTADAEWIQSKYVSTDASTNDEFTAHLLGNDVGSAPNFTSVGIIKGFEQTRLLPQLDDPKLGTYFNSSWMSNLFDNEAAQDDILDNIDHDNDRPPYDSLDIVGASNLTNPLTVGATCLHGAQMVSTIAGFCAPFGLLQITHQSGNPTDSIMMLIEVAPGSYKGVKSLGI